MSGGGLWEVRSLVLDLRDRGTTGWGEELSTWFGERLAVVAELHDVGRPANHARQVDRGDQLLCDLYALSRLVDLVIGPHQPSNDDPALLAWTTGKPWWSGPEASATAWETLCAAIGATDIAEEDFHPFFHEIVAVQPADDPDAPPELVEQHWPGALIGGMLLTRAGVSVRAGSHWLDPDVASRSCLYWAWWRRNRVVRDLSHGWGGNSQWGTDFRRDYIVGNELHYNIDSVGLSMDIAEEDMVLSPSDRVDLLRFRHSVRADLGDDRFPYYDTFVEPRHSPG